MTPIVDPVGCNCSDADCATYGCKRYWPNGNRPSIPAHQWPWMMGFPPSVQGCVCPPTSEQTCQNKCCPRKGPHKLEVTC